MSKTNSSETETETETEPQLKEVSECGRLFAEILRKNNDPEEREKARIRKNREDNFKNNREDVGL